jgi:hypothetical protein
MLEVFGKGPRSFKFLPSLKREVRDVRKRPPASPQQWCVSLPRSNGLHWDSLPFNTYAIGIWELQPMKSYRTCPILVM